MIDNKFVSNIELYNWAYDRKVSEVLEKLHYKHRETIIGNVLDIASIFLEEGINVMIVKGEDFYSLRLDSKSFHQR